jgi:hypothetical protein
MKIFDISVGIDENLPVWPGDPKPELSWIGRISAGICLISRKLHRRTHNYRKSTLMLRSIFFRWRHSGQYCALTLVGEAQVLEVPEMWTLITAEVLTCLRK